MAEEEESEQEEEPGEADMEADGPKGAWLKQFVILAVLVLIGQSVVAYFLVTEQIMPWYFGEEETTEAVKEAEALKREPVIVEAPVLYDVPEMIVNPQDFHTIRYLNVKMSLEFDLQETLDMVEADPVTPAKLVEVIRTTLNMTSFYDMDEARERGPLRKKIADEVNESGLLGEGSVRKVNFERFVAQ
ncbi:MAG: flagellar basal body-associated FliL family protein [Candidatus Latescibacteria bacterium]|nr:flagellar basal body-associated FliL family protein [Candidatus Latescibacterota bacterium]